MALRWPDMLPKLATSIYFALIAALLAAPSASALAQTKDETSADIEFLDAINDIRKAHGLNRLVLDDNMSDVALKWSKTMVKKDLFKHSPSLIPGAPDGWRKVGENVGRYGRTTDQLMDAFMGSAEHKANILDPRWESIGIGTVIDKDGYLWTTHRFADVSRPAVKGKTDRTCFGHKATIKAKPGKVTVGTSGRDVIIGTSGDDVIKGKGGNDLICAGAGNDKVRGGKGKDRIRGGPGRDLLIGGKGKDTLKGGKGKDTIRRRF